MIHWSSGREGHNNYRRDLVIWLVHLIYSAVDFALCYIYVILNYCIRFAVLPCVRLCLNSCYNVSANRGLSISRLASLSSSHLEHSFRAPFIHVCMTSLSCG